MCSYTRSFVLSFAHEKRNTKSCYTSHDNSQLVNITRKLSCTCSYDAKHAMYVVLYMIFDNVRVQWTECYTYLITETVRQTRLLLPVYRKQQPSHAGDFANLISRLELHIRNRTFIFFHIASALLRTNIYIYIYMYVHVCNKSHFCISLYRS